VVFTLMLTWKQGRTHLGAQPDVISLEDFLKKIEREQPARVPGVAVFMTGRSSGTPTILLHHLKHNHVLHKTVVLLTVQPEDRPRVPRRERLETEKLNQGFSRMVLHYGFMETPNVPRALSRLPLFEKGEADLAEVSYYVGHQTLLPDHQHNGLAMWQKKLFALLARNAVLPVSFYNLPNEQVFELGVQIEF
jgi:KUP system potassium uptake protein